jgi:hypothetical protein
MNIVLIILLLLQIKHFICDFPLQTDLHIAAKGQYGNFYGIEHSVFHGFGTALAFSFFVPLHIAIVLSLLDVVLHYHIDWIKSNYGCKGMKDKLFWTHLGLDQLAHQMCYLIYVYLFLSI